MNCILNEKIIQVTEYTHHYSLEQIPVGEVLSCHVTNGQLGQYHFSATLVQSFEFVVQDLPFGINDCLVLLCK